jgi:diguanylate cyclase (GGDEF)-like protein
VVGGSGPTGHDGAQDLRADLLRDVFDLSPVAILRVTHVGEQLGEVINANSAAGRLLGVPGEGLRGRSLTELLPAVADRGKAAPGATQSAIAIPGPDGSPRWIAVSATPLPASEPGADPRALVILHDVTEQWSARDQLDRRARHDPLTGLINRGELLSRLAAVDSESGGPLVGVIYLDLDGFKLVNDTRGHQVGDELLVAVARRIRAVLRPQDSLARLGGDEFVILSMAVADPQDLAAVAERVRSTLDEPVSVGGREHRISMSVGIALAAADDLDADNLLRQADMAMYRAKDAGRNTVRVHSVEMDQELATAELIREALGVALAVDASDVAAPGAGLVLHFQPIVEINSGRLSYVEALTRLRVSDGTLIYPSQFLPVAARAGLNGALSERVLREALRQRALWRGDGIDVPVGLNLAHGQVYSAAFAGDALRLIAEQGDTPRGVVFEMGEFGLLEPTGPAQLTLRRLRQSGIGLAIDHFGTGYSSLGALRFLGPHRVKIDRSFVASITDSDADRAIVTAAVSAAHALGQRVVAEGVETPEQLETLSGLGCDEAQGFLVAHVLPADDLHLASTSWAPGTLARSIAAG